MQTPAKQSCTTNRNAAALFGLLVLAALALPLRAAEQPKPGPEHKKMEVSVGQWAYEGSAQASPFGPASKFKGKETARMVLGGYFLETEDLGEFFLETQADDTSGSGYPFQGIYLQGYDSLTKSYFRRGFENDGTANSSSTTVSGNTWTSTSSRTDSKGKAHKTRTVVTYSSDGRTSSFVAEYLADDGNTGLPNFKVNMKRVEK